MIWNFLKQFLKSVPETDGVGTKELILYVLIAACSGATAFVLLNINRQPMLMVAVIFGVCIFFTIKEYLNIARWVSLLSALGVVAYLMITNLGIRDSIMPGLLVILYAGGLLAGRKGTVIIGLLSLGIVIFTRILEQGLVIRNRLSEYNFLTDYITVIIVIIVAAILQWLIIDHTHKNFQKSQEEFLKLEKTQKLLFEAESRYRNLVEKIPVVIYLSEPGDAGKWQYVSPQIFAMTGYTPNEWTGNQHLWYSRVHPEDRLRVIEQERTALESGSMPLLEYRLLTKDGRYIWIFDESLLFVDSSQHAMVQGFMLDITARKVAEEQLQHRLKELEAMKGVSEALITHSDLNDLIENTGEQIRQNYKTGSIFIAIHDPSTNLIHFPYEYEDGIRRVEGPIQYGQGLSTQIMEMKKPLLINRNWNEEIKKYNPLYRTKKLVRSTIAVPMITKDKIIGVISLDSIDENAFSENDVRLLSTIANNLAVAIENTNLQESLKKELEIQEKLVTELEQKNEELERFTYTASHDLKSPLITIRGFLGYIEQDTRSGNAERLASDIQRISEATEKMHRMLTDLLELSRVGHVIKKAENIPFDEIIQDALERVEGQLKEKHILVKVRSGFPIVYVDRERLVEVMQNLIDNASKFMGEQKNPRIEIDMKKENDVNVFYVKDNGIGIRKEFHQKIFGLFDKLDSSSDGTGIGLALVKRIIEMHGGKIWIDSEEGKGTTFYFTLSEAI